jgi:hypothetical protein
MVLVARADTDIAARVNMASQADTASQVLAVDTASPDMAMADYGETMTGGGNIYHQIK